MPYKEALTPDTPSAGLSLADVWDTEYRSGRYDGEPPLEFAVKIAAELKERAELLNGRGLYVGCGNGRNYIMLSKSGLDIVGLDVSGAGLEKIAKSHPELATKLVHNNFLDYDGKPFRYIIAIQSFQHGTGSIVERYFHRAANMLGRGGLLFLRVNASDTTVLHPHSMVEESNGGFTVLYEGGPKKGLHIHFFSMNELETLVSSNGMRIERRPKKVTIRRPGQRGMWSQWEMTVVKEG